MSAILPIIISVGLKLLEWFLGKAKDDKEMMELFYKFVERQHQEYLNSAIMRARAKERWDALAKKPFVESP